MAHCLQIEPSLEHFGGDRQVACHLYTNFDPQMIAPEAST
jgi:hypothetical protein